MEEEIIAYSWIEGAEIVADVFTKKKRLKRDVLEEIVFENKVKHAQTNDNLVVYDNDEFRVKNLVTKKTREQKGR